MTPETSGFTAQDLRDILVRDGIEPFGGDMGMKIDYALTVLVHERAQAVREGSVPTRVVLAELEKQRPLAWLRQRLRHR